MAALLNNPIDNLASGDDDNEYKKMLMAQLQQQQDMPQADTGPSQNQLIASLSGAANQLGTVGGRTAQNPEVQRYADLIDKNKSFGEQQRIAQLNKQQSILAELAKMRDQSKMKASDLAFQDKKQQENRAFEDQKQKALFAQQLALEKQKESSSQRLAEMKGENKKPPTADQANSSMFAVRAKDAANLAKQIEDSGYKPSEYSASFRSMEIPFVGQPFANDADRSYDQARRDFVSSVLRKESGAAISDKEYNNEAKKYFPQPGDGPQQVAQKAAARERAIAGLINASGPAYNPELQQPFHYQPEQSPGSAYAASPKGPKAGDVEDGYRFKGGNPSDPASWEEVK